MSTHGSRSLLDRYSELAVRVGVDLSPGGTVPILRDGGWVLE